MIILMGRSEISELFYYDGDAPNKDLSQSRPPRKRQASLKKVEVQGAREHQNHRQAGSSKPAQQHLRPVMPQQHGDKFLPSWKLKNTEKTQASIKGWRWLGENMGEITHAKNTRSRLDN